VLKCIDELKPSGSSGPDLISNKLIKTFKFEIAAPLLQIINGSITHGIFPDIWKQGYVTPIFKRGSRSSPNNYRPVVLMSCLGKVLEAAVRSKFVEHLSLILPENMFGFQAGKSTGDALVAITDQAKLLRSQGQKVCLISMDASCAFDLVNHDLITGSLARLGVGKRMLDWTLSFLTDCSLSVRIDEEVSSPWNPDIGAGQGRRFSPDLFNVSSLTSLFWCLYSFAVNFADDGMDVVAGNTPAECEKKVRITLEERIKWFDAAGLSLNLSKTEFMGIGFDPTPISYGSVTISPSSSMKFLGVTLQDNLKWDKTVETICNRMRFSACKIRNEGRFFDCWDRKKLFNGWFLGPLYASALAFLPVMNTAQRQKIQVAMNSGVRAIANIPQYGHHNLSALRKKLGIPSIDQITENLVQMAAWKQRDRFLTQVTNMSGPETRSRALGKVIQPIQKGYLGQMVSTAVACGWNRLPNEIKSENNPTKAKKLIRHNIQN